MELNKRRGFAFVRQFNEKLPAEIRQIAGVLRVAGFQAHAVGGCVRDALLGRQTRDWDIATDAIPDEIQKLFPESIYENDFGTVGIKTGSDIPVLKVVEVTPYRAESKYSDKRHPDRVTFVSSLLQDLCRRDFTINALAVAVYADPSGVRRDEALVDCVQDGASGARGETDLRDRLIRAVGEPGARFAEDALRLVRAVRFAAELGFEVEEKTAAAVVQHAGLLEFVAKERVRDEFSKIVMSGGAMRGVQMLEDLGLLRHIMPELRDGIGCGQNKHHIYTVWDHNLRALDYTASKGCSLTVRLGALLHDVGKPRTKRGDGPDSTFHGHEVVGARVTARIMDRLRFSKEVADQVIHLVRHHLFYYNVGEVSAAGVRRFLARVGVETIDDLINIREADRIGSGVPKAKPYKIRHLLFMIEKVRRDPTSPKMLGVRGEDVMRIAGIPQSPRVGEIIAALMDEVLEDPARNTREHLEARIAELSKMGDAELRALAASGREKMREEDAAIEETIKTRYHV